MRLDFWTEYTDLQVTDTVSSASVSGTEGISGTSTSFRTPLYNYFTLSMNNEPTSSLTLGTRGYWVGIGWGNNGRMDSSDIAYCFFTYTQDDTTDEFVCKDAYTNSN